MKIIALKNYFAVIVAFGLLTGCSTTAPFSQKAYEQATSLKVEALTTMDKATDQFSNQKQGVETLKLNIEKAYEYSKGRPQNEETTRQWEIIRNPSRNSLGGFLKRWEESRTLRNEFIQETKGIVSDGFDTIIELESGKRKPSDGQKQ